MRRAAQFMLAVIVLLMLTPLLAIAQPTGYQKQWWSSPDYSFNASSAQRAIGVIDAQLKGYRGIVSPGRGYLIAGVAGAAVVNMNNVGGTAVGGYFIAEGTGIGGGLQDEVTGVYSRVDKNGRFWSAALHGECILDSPDSGGLCLGLNVELYGANPKTKLIGANIQPKGETRNVIGLQFQDLAPAGSSSYEYAIKMPNLGVQIGEVDGDHFCMRFDPKSQKLEFWRRCGLPGSTRVGFVDMNYGAPDVPLNR